MTLNTTWFSPSALKKRGFCGKKSPLFRSSPLCISSFRPRDTETTARNPLYVQQIVFRHGNNTSSDLQRTASQLGAVPDRVLRARAFKDSLQWEQLFFFFLLSQSFLAHGRTSSVTGTLMFSHHLRTQGDLLFQTYTHLSVTDVGKQQWATDRRAGTCKHAEHCTLFWHNRNACFPTQALDTKRVLTTVLSDDNRVLCNAPSM